ncbi:hypothetical protein [Roseimicrobium sp. ORNL1]|uniref:hypothetical protein n=1 Tax=Roseimicrobium sp. ORNL1 TaxID=2711231 RepID=UPI0019820A90|nr:hypothetical protein [Roseimicrobium sp. ORNL1]
MFLRLEYKTHCLSGCLFDPMPTRWHFMVLLIVPLTHSLALIGARWRAPWFQGVVQFLWWPSLIIPAYYVMALGPLVQGYGLFASVFFAGCWALHGVGLLTSELDRSDVELASTLTLIILPMLAVVGWFALLPWVIRSAEGISRFRLRPLWVSGVLSVFVAIGLAELPMVKTFWDLKAYAKGQTKGVVPPWLLNDNQVALVSRLRHAPQQFSSDGMFDCEGPVDVFGPTVRMLNGWATPTELWNRSYALHNETGGKLLDQIKELNPAADTFPRAWRRLSKWERWEIEHNKDSKHLHGPR